MEPVLCYIRESYFIERRHFVKMLDTGNTMKQSHRTHLCVKIEMNGYIKAAKKKRDEKEPLYRESSLINFRTELDIKSYG